MFTADRVERISTVMRPINMRPQMRQLRTLVAVAGLAVLAACGSQDATDDPATAVPEDGAASESPPGAPVVGSRWVLSSLKTAAGTVEPPADATPYLQIDDNGQVVGSTGCNGFGGSAQVGEGSISFSPLIATKMACSGVLGDLDSAILGVLDGDVTTSVSGDDLKITNAAGDSLNLRLSAEPSPSAT